MKYLALTIPLIFFLASCSSLTVSYDYDKEADFNSFKTYTFYGWAKDSDQILNDLNKKRFEEAAAKEFNNRGLTYVENGADLVVSMFIVIDQKTGTTAYTNHYGTGPYGYGYPGWGWGMGYSSTTYQQYDYLVGTLVIDVFNDSSKQLIWQGVASATIDENNNNRERNINKAVHAIMANYPVAPVKDR